MNLLIKDLIGLQGMEKLKYFMLDILHLLLPEY